MAGNSDHIEGEKLDGVWAGINYLEQVAKKC